MRSIKRIQKFTSPMKQKKEYFIDLGGELLECFPIFSFIIFSLFFNNKYSLSGHIKKQKLIFIQLLFLSYLLNLNSQRFIWCQCNFISQLTIFRIMVAKQYLIVFALIFFRQFSTMLFTIEVSKNKQFFIAIF